MTAVCADAVVTETGPNTGDACDTAAAGSRARTLVTSSRATDLDSRRAGVQDAPADRTDISDTPAPDNADTEPTEVVLAAIRLRSEVVDIVATSSSGGQVYAATVDAIVVIDTAHQLVHTIPMAGHPKRMVANAARTHIVVTTYEGPVVIINTTDNTTTTVRVTPATVDAVSQCGTCVYLGGTAASGIGLITALNLTDTTTLTIPVAGRITALVVSTDGRRLYAAASERVAHRQYDPGWLVVIDTATFTILDTISVGASPQAIAASSDGSRTYIGHPDTDSISVVDASTLNVTTVWLPDSPLELTVSPDCGTVYVINRNSLAIIDAATHTVQTVAAGRLPRRLEFGPDGKQAYVTHFGGHTVSVIDTLTKAVTTKAGIPRQ